MLSGASTGYPPPLRDNSPSAAGRTPTEAGEPSFEIVIPTKNRPAKLGRCLDAIAVAREQLEAPVLVCDSSDERRHAEVRAVCGRHPFVTLRRHWGNTIAAARNECANAATADVLISVDDDVCVAPDALAVLAAAYLRVQQPGVVAGSIAWNGVYHRPVVMRRIGYGRPALEGESPTFLISALIAFPRELGRALPWNERIPNSDDIFIGALWRSRGVRLEFEPRARADHDPEQNHYGVETQASHVYANLFDALFVAHDIRRALAYELLGFAAGCKAYCRTPASAVTFLFAWARGNLALVHDWGYLRRLVRTELPAACRPS